MASNHLSKVPEIAEALAWLRQAGWPTSVQDIALGADIWAQIQGEALSAEQATSEPLTRLIKQLAAGDRSHRLRSRCPVDRPARAACG